MEKVRIGIIGVGYLGTQHARILSYLEGRGDPKVPREEHGIAEPVPSVVRNLLRSSQRRLDCGNPMCGFARIRCPDCCDVL